MATRVAVLTVNGDPSGLQAIVDQLNDDTYHDFTASLVGPTGLDSETELAAYDVVVIGDNGTGSNYFDNTTLTSALQSWLLAGKGLVATGWTVYGAGSYTGSPVAAIDAMVPVNTAGSYSYFGPGSPITPSGSHPITNGVGSFSTSGNAFVEYPSSSPQVDAGATVLATVSGAPVAAAGTFGLGRTVYLGPTYSGTGNTTSLRTGAADRLLEQAVAWASEAPPPPPATGVRVGVLATGGDNTGMLATVNQLNNDTYFDFTATLVGPASIDSAAELAAYDVIVIGDNWLNQNYFDNAAMTSALQSWLTSGNGKGLVATGWTIYGAGSYTGSPVAAIDAMVPVNTAGSYSYYSPGYQIVPTASHAITNGVGSFTTGTYTEVPTSSPVVDAGATTLAMINGNPVAAAGSYGTGRTVYLGMPYAMYGGTDTSSLRTDAADRLLEQAVAWAANPIPRVVSTSPAYLSTTYGPSIASMTVTFSEAVTAASAQNVANYRLVGPSGARIPVTTAALDAPGTTVTLTFPAQTTTGNYRLFVGGIADAQGGAMPSLAVSYEAPAFYGDGNDYYLWSSTMGDFTGDGRPDLVVDRNGQGSMSLFRGLPGGAFDAGSFLSIPGGIPSGDWKPDLTSADLNGDGRLDLIEATSNHGVGVYFGTGSGTFSSRSTPLGMPTLNFYTVEVADISGDGRLDIVAGSPNGYIVTLVNNGAADLNSWSSVVSSGPSLYDLHLTDLDGDGVTDIVGTYSNTVYQFRGSVTPRGAFSYQSSYTVPASGTDTSALADLDRDGRPDVIVGASGVGILYGENTLPNPPWFSTQQNLGQTTPNNFSPTIAVSDLDGDGDLDLVRSDWGTGDVYITWNQGNRTYTSQFIDVPNTNYVWQLHTVDITGDGLPDIVGADYYSGQVFVLRSRSGVEASLFGFVRNLAPTPGADVETATVLEDGSAVPINVLANDTDPEGDAFTITAVTQGLHGSVAITGGGTGLSYTPTEADYFGSESFTYTVTDSKGNTATATVSFAIRPVNDAPSFASGSNVAVVQDSGTYSAPWATTLSAGPLNEALQSLSFEVTGTTDPGLFAVLPTLAADGTLSFTPAAGAYGSATITVVLKDNGGTGDGGVDTSAPASFTIHVNDVTGPQVSDIRVRWGTRWESIRNVSRILPWQGINAVEVTFDEDVAVDAADAALTGINVAGYTLGNFQALSPRKAAWDLLTPVNIDRLLLTLDGDSAGAITDLSGNRLRGDGLTAGTDYTKSFRVLPGDINGDGVVNALDVTQVNQQRLGLVAVTMFGDIDGDGDVDLEDYNTVRRKLNTRLTV